MNERINIFSYTLQIQSTDSETEGIITQRIFCQLMQLGSTSSHKIVFKRTYIYKREYNLICNWKNNSCTC